jgi:hypothetical protein
MSCLSIDQEIGRRSEDYLSSFHATHSRALGDALMLQRHQSINLQSVDPEPQAFPMKHFHFFVQAADEARLQRKDRSLRERPLS